MSAGQDKKRFRVQAESKEEPGVWPTAHVRVFEGDRQIGAYERNYAPYSEQAFEPFEWEGRWFALYSPEYTATRVMSLPDCQDLGGEEPSGMGFCPVEFLVPRYREVTRIQSITGERVSSSRFSSEIGEDDLDVGPWITAPTAFVAGCVWGDDSTWKLECIDIPSAVTGKIVRTARFGHVELAHDTLAKSIRLDLWEGDLRMTLLRQERDVAIGAVIDPYA